MTANLILISTGRACPIDARVSIDQAEVAGREYQRTQATSANACVVVEA